MLEVGLAIRPLDFERDHRSRIGAPVYLDQAKVFVGICIPHPIGIFRRGILCIGVGQAAGGEIIERVWPPPYLESSAKCTLPVSMIVPEAPVD